MKYIVVAVDEESFRRLMDKVEQVEHAVTSDLEWCAIGILKKMEQGEEKATIVQKESGVASKPLVPNIAA
jgi:hypothetical protein